MQNEVLWPTLFFSTDFEPPLNIFIFPRRVGCCYLGW